MKKKLNKSGWEPQSGIISTCTYCGSQVGNSQKYCPEHRTQAGRKKTFEENAEIIRENKEKGMDTPDKLKNWE